MEQEEDMDETTEAEQQAVREEEARRMAKDKWGAVVNGLWIEPNAKVQTTSDGQRHVLAWISVDEEP